MTMVTAPFRLHVIGVICFVPAAWSGASAKTSNLSFSNTEKGRLTKTPYDITSVFLLRFPSGFLYSLHRQILYKTLLKNFDIISGKLVVVVWNMVGTRKTGKHRKNVKKSNLQVEFENDFSMKVLPSKTNVMQEKSVRQKKKDKIVACSGE